MTATTFDTLKYARTLKESGVPDEQAEAQAEAIKEAFSEALETQLATKADVYSIMQAITKLEARTVLLQWMLGLVIVAEVIPLLAKWL